MKKKKPEFTAFQKKVMFESATEPPFQNEYWNEKRAGLYVDRFDGTPLFTSLDKFDSGCGWPSFTKPIVEKNVLEINDYSHFMNRIEVKSTQSKIHLGHVFNDGPVDQGGLRYCINSAAIRFIPLEDLAKEGYADYLKYFQ
jgi:methionine-R-sulfoxide reductase